MILKQPYDEKQEDSMREYLREAFPLDSLAVSESLIKKTLYAIESDISKQQRKRQKNRKKYFRIIATASVAMLTLWMSIPVSDLTFEGQGQKLVEKQMYMLESSSCDKEEAEEATMETKEPEQEELQNKYILGDSAGLKQEKIRTGLFDRIALSVDEVIAVLCQKTPESDWVTYESESEIYEQYQLINQYILEEYQDLTSEEVLKEQEIGKEETYYFYTNQNKTKGFKIIIIDQYFVLYNIQNMEENETYLIISSN